MGNRKVLPIILLVILGHAILGTSAAGRSSSRSSHQATSLPPAAISILPPSYSEKDNTSNGPSSGRETLAIDTAPTAYSRTGIIQTGMLTSYTRNLASQSTGISTSVQWTIYTVYTTREHTVTRCAATVTNCPADSTRISTSTIAVSTTSRPMTVTDWTSTWPSSLETVPLDQTSSCFHQSNDCSAIDSNTSQTINPTFSLPIDSSPTNESPTPLADTTIYTTREITVTSCADTVTDCPARSTKVTTFTSSISTQTPSKDNTSEPSGHLSTASITPIETPSTVYTTRELTVTSCAPNIPDCPGHSSLVSTPTAPFPTSEWPVTDTSQVESGSTPVGDTTGTTSTSSLSISANSSDPTFSTSQAMTSSLEPAPSSGQSALLNSTTIFVIRTTTTLCSATTTITA